MDERVAMVIFFVVFLLIYGSMHFYVLSKIAKFFKLEKNWWFYAILIFLAISFFIASMLETRFDNGITKAFHFISATWMGVLFFLFFLILVYDIINLVKPLPLLGSGITILTIALLLTIYSIVNAATINIKTVNIESSKIDKPLSIVQISDVHLGPINGPDYLKLIVLKANDQNPDIVLITGDLLDGRYKYDPKDFQSLNTLKGNVYFTTGNHEFYAGVDLVTNLLNDTKVQILRNEATNFDKIQIIGIDDAEDRKQVAKQLENMTLNTSQYIILMYHRPPGFADAAAKGIDLMTVGHTHAGQIYPFNYISALYNGPVRGLHQLNNSYLYVSEGTGTWGPPMRFFSKNEITEINLIKR